MTEQELRDLLALGVETRRVEFKTSISWTDEAAKVKITRSILGMSNLRDGGVIVIGVSRQPNGTYLDAGVTEADRETYDSDEVGRYVQEYAAPSADFSMQFIRTNGRDFIVFVVKEFHDVPVVCRKDGPVGLKRGTIFTRTNIPETVPVSGETEMRELIEMAVDKGMRRLIQRLADIGLIHAIVIPERVEDADAFRSERFDIER